ncbi:DUF1771-domain-containing protein [Coniophora puteana RWD-64-598 SS2]|uniref:DUF1771-domain-containing protein n=1 Tax=Coniophora puteana (strain RWD-64-598) TaxID=741705 RepID=A0A5M3MVX8_CONPW|nr:DUF1771-domain-containing protein [Coniophora puteana RWD-64-598 SS2]EIW83318.1 DUF1771-domain-containing protein [Coniophora puteana RWD-64-598 SS2]
MPGFGDFIIGLIQALCGGQSSKDQAQQIDQPYQGRPSAPGYTAYPPPQASQAEAPRPPAEEEKPKPHHKKKHEKKPSKPSPEPVQQAPFESHVIPPEKHHSGDPNQVNQHNEHYMSLRAQANEAGDKMSKCFQESHEAYSNGNGARAKELSNEGKRNEAEMQRLNKEASEWIFQANNTDSQPGEVDLHGLYVKEAISFSDKAIKDARARGDAEIRLIVGKGLHSEGHVAKIKPALEELMKQHNVPTEVDPKNAGVLIVHLDLSR